jgi:hypothetical protein
LTEAEVMRGDWIDPDAGLVPFGGYAQAWVTERPNLRPKTIQLYGGQMVPIVPEPDLAVSG